MLNKHLWDGKEECTFYTPYVYCLDQYLKHGLQKFDDNVLQERQLLKVVYGDQTLLEELTSFIEEVVKNGGEVSKEEVVAFYTYHPEFERFTGTSRTGRPRPSRRSAQGWDIASTLTAKATAG